jgi:hypothetical protein
VWVVVVRPVDLNVNPRTRLLRHNDHTRLGWWGNNHRWRLRPYDHWRLGLWRRVDGNVRLRLWCRLLAANQADQCERTDQKEKLLHVPSSY